MKKLFGFLLITMFGFAMMASGASAAATLALTADQQVTAASLNQTAVFPTYYPAEAVVPSTVKIAFTTGALDATMPGAVALVGGAIPKSITYNPSTNLPSGTRVVFTLTNGKWLTTSAYYLIKDEGPTDFDGVTVASADSVTSTVLTFIVGSTPIDAGTTMILSTSQDTVNGDTRTTVANPVITMDAGLAAAGTYVTLGVTQCYDSVGAIAGGIASAIPVVGSYQQFAWTRTAGAGTINVETPDLRKTFLASALLPATPGTLKLADNQAAADVDLVLAGAQVANFAIALNTAALATYDYTITGAQLNKLATVNGLVLDMNNGNANDKAFTIASDASATLSVATNDNVLWYDATADDVDFTVNGTSTLDIQTFNASALLNFADNTKYNDVALASGSIMVWDINGWQATVPYHWASTTAAEDTFIKIFNNSSINAEVTADVTNDAGTVVDTVTIGTVNAGTVGIFWANNIATLAGVSSPGAFAAVYTVNAPKDSITAMVNQKRPGGVDRVVPIYTGAAGAFKNY